MPGFAVDPGQIYFLESPSEFHEFILEAIENSRKRVILSTLYMGCENEREIKLVSRYHHFLARAINWLCRSVQ